MAWNKKEILSVPEFQLSRLKNLPPVFSRVPEFQIKRNPA
jgi:hypothetical protein